MSSQSSDLPPGPLAGIRVLDLGTMLAAPYGATLMGDLGADVIKVESHRGDDSRHLGPQRDGERSSYLSLNRSKRAIVLELKREAGREVFGRLAATADVLITNIRQPSLSKLGLDYEQVREHRPDIIWIGVTAFGADGPYAGRPGIDFLAQGFGGLLALNGEPDGEPVRVTVPLIDVLTSLLVTSAALTALRKRDQTGEGQRIDISLLDALLHAQAGALGTFLIAGEPTPRTGNRSLYFAPSGIYLCGDGGRLVVTCPSEKFFRNLCLALEVDWLDDPRFQGIDQRLANQDELDRRIGERCKDFTVDELQERLVAADVPCAPVNGAVEVTKDPQIRHNRMIVTLDHPKLGPVDVTGVPIHFHGTPCEVRRPPPLQGQHSEELLGELGYAPEEIAELVADDVVATPVQIAKASSP